MAKLREENRAKEADEMFNKLREIHIKTQNIDDNVRENRESTIKEFGDLKLHISKNYVDVDTFKTFKDENREDHAEIFKKINGN